ncbi:MULTISPECIES: heme o synthase [Rhodomicrobium]|uniref:heme o synthase n=1 Tax=Rhodomicrobium TaxID=1068 RepID=UPI000B4B76DA|nr:MULTISPECIES: heme o synthase [Rhodomicrobium]
MSDISAAQTRNLPEDGGATQGALRDYLLLLKPRVMSLAIFTALAGMIAAPGPLHPLVAFTALIFIAAGAGACGALNMWYDADIDRQMSRTALRPIPQNRVPPVEVLSFGLVLAAGSVFCLGVLVNWVASGLLALTIAYYIVIYTMWLKRRTPQNIVVGGAAGAFPPMIGWAVTTGSVSVESILLFTIIFLWTPPHFWALALYRMRDYERAGVPMLPNVAGKDETRRQILLYSLPMAASGIAPGLIGLGGPLYLAVSTVLGAIFLYLAWMVFRRREGHPADKAARALFSFSIFYLFALFAVLLAEHGLRLV